MSLVNVISSPDERHRDRCRELVEHLRGARDVVGAMLPTPEGIALVTGVVSALAIAEQRLAEVERRLGAAT